MPADRSAEIADTLAAVLGPRPVPRDELPALLAEAGLSPAPSDHEISRALQFAAEFTEVTGGVMHMPSVLEGTTWVAYMEPADDERFLRVEPHLVVLGWWLIEESTPLRRGDGSVTGRVHVEDTEVEGFDREVDVMLGPEGWLDGLGGRWITVAVRGGEIVVDPIDEPPAPTARLVAAIEAGFEASTDDEMREIFDDQQVMLRFGNVNGVLDEALATHRDAFLDGPIPPIPELYAASGLEIRGALVAEYGFDWESLRDWQLRNQLMQLEGLTGREADGVRMLIGACRSFVVDGVDGLGPDEQQQEGGAILLAATLELPEVSRVFWRRIQDLTGVSAFLDHLAEVMGDVDIVGVPWLQAKVLDERGDPVAADALLTRITAGECRHPGALADAASFAADRGDARTAARLAAAARAMSDDGDDALLELIEQIENEVGPFLTRPRATVGRNDPCPCGSGRKYKQCHAGKEELPLDQRAAWLFEKARRYLVREGLTSEVDDLAEVISHHRPEILDIISDSPLPADLYLHEGGAFAEFYEARQALLPADEAMLAAQWMLIDRSVFEITAVGPTWLELWDIGRNESIRVENLSTGRGLNVGGLVFGRPLPVGDTYRVPNGLSPLDRRWVNELLDAFALRDEYVIAEAIAATYAPPRMSNTEGQPLRLHELRWRIDDHATLAASLTSVGFDDHGDGTFALTRTTDTMPNAVIATLRIEGDELVAEVNSDQRAREVVELLEVAGVGSDDHVDRVYTDEELAEFVAAQTQPRPPDDPEVLDALRAAMAQMEDRWLDESIPALAGRTPREAVQDPIGREQVDQLLATFPDLDTMGGIGMNANRIRRLLGLPER